MNSALIITLAVAVPLRIAELQAEGGRSREALERARQFADVLATQGDVLQFGGRKGKAATLFNDLTYVLAVLAYQPGRGRFAWGALQA
jgi:hypothetical protein